MDIVYNDEYYIAVIKKRGIATVPLSFNDEKETLLKNVISICKDVNSVKGRKECEKGALHRLDTDTTGIVIFAKNDLAFKKFTELQKQNKVLKTYKAFIGDTEKLLGFIEYNNKMESDFRAYGPKRKAVRPIKGTSYKTNIVNITNNLITVTITKGFRHQIRSHLAWREKAIEGDKLYGSKVDKPLQLYATGLSFTHPFTKEKVNIEVDLEKLISYN